MTTIASDLHTHTSYSDGWDWEEMAETAAAAGLEAIGFTDHCPLGEDAFDRRARYDFEATYEDRRAEFEARRGAYDVAILDGAEVNYDPRKESRIRSFLAEAGFDYTIGSVHFAGPYDLAHPPADMADATAERRRAVIDTYLEWQVELIESDLFSIVGHLDLTQRAASLRDVLQPADYERLASALADSRTVPEINAGRLDRSYGRIHPDPDRLSIFAEAGVGFVLGTDSHAPDQLERRVDLLSDTIADLPVEILDREAVLGEE